MSGQTLWRGGGRPLGPPPPTRKWAGRLVGKTGQGARGVGAPLQPAVAGAKQSFNTPGRRCLGEKLGGWAKDGGVGSRGRSKEGQDTPPSCPGDCLGLLTLCYVLCSQ